MIPTHKTCLKPVFQFCRARKDYFQMAAVRQREDVIQQQARLLEEANRKLDQNLNHNPKQVEQKLNPNPKQVEQNMNHKQVEPAVRSKQAVLQPLNMIEKEPDFHKPAMAIHTTPNAQNSSMTQQEIRKSVTSSKTNGCTK